MKRLFLTTLSLGLCFIGSAQQIAPEVEANDKMEKENSGIVGKPLEGTFIGFRNPPSNDETWMPSLRRVSKNEGENDEVLRKIKEEKNRLKELYAIEHGGAKTTAGGPGPVLGTNFAGIHNGGVYTPLDNTIAISDKDTIVTFVNTAVAYYTASGTNTYMKDIHPFINDASITNALCDPKVIFDNVARRFIFYVQVCDEVAANSKVILGFSKTSNPANGWNFYKFTGNPLNNNCWWDYPKLGISNDEVFVTGNLFNAGGGPFSQSAIYQIKKAPCYAGNTLVSSDAKYYTSPYFTILPASHAQQGSYGPGIFLTSTSSSTGSLKFYWITNNLASGSAVLNTYDIVVPPFSAAGDASQQGTPFKLNTGDSRAQDGFYMKGNVHLVFHKDVGSGYSGIAYYRINSKTLALTSSSFGNVGSTDIAYPAVAPATNDSNDKSVVVAYSESGSSMFPRTCAVKCDDGMGWSLPTVVKAGLGYVSYPFTSGPSERWGDYTGLAKRYGDPNATLWMAGDYGGASHIWLQWIAQLNAFKLDVTETAKVESNVKVFPNPIVDFYHVEFTVPERQIITINITDIEGRIVTELYNNIAESGQNRFTFNKASLSPGVYSLNIIGATTNIKNEKIVIAGK